MAPCLCCKNTTKLSQHRDSQKSSDKHTEGIKCTNKGKLWEFYSLQDGRVCDPTCTPPRWHSTPSSLGRGWSSVCWTRRRCATVWTGSSERWAPLAPRTACEWAIAWVTEYANPEQPSPDESGTLRARAGEEWASGQQQSEHTSPSYIIIWSCPHRRHSVHARVCIRTWAVWVHSTCTLFLFPVHVYNCILLTVIPVCCQLLDSV